jgi:hypothetical protein
MFLYYFLNIFFKKTYNKIVSGWEASLKKLKKNSFFSLLQINFCLIFFSSIQII